MRSYEETGRPRRAPRPGGAAGGRFTAGDRTAGQPKGGHTRYARPGRSGGYFLPLLPPLPLSLSPSPPAPMDS